MKSILSPVVVGLMLLALGLSACVRGGLTLPLHYDEANTHMANSIDYSNEFTGWINGLSEQRRPTSEEWLDALQLLQRAIAEARLVSDEFMGLAHPDLPGHWKGLFIPSMEKAHLYYFNAVNDPDSVESPSTDKGVQQLNVLIEAHTLHDLWGDWYDAHRNDIRAGIRQLAE